MGKKVIVSVDPFAQPSDSTLAEINAVAVGQGGNAAEVIRDINGKVVQVAVNLPDTASQAALDAISGNKGVAAALQFPTVLYDEKFDTTAVGALPSNPDWTWRFGGGTVNVQAENPDTGANALKFFAGRPRVGLNHTGPFSAFLAVGRTVESQARFRFSAFSDVFDIHFGQTDIDTRMFVDVGGVLKMNSGAAVATLVGVDVYHTIKITELIGSSSVSVEVNGVPAGSFPVTPSGFAWRSNFFGISVTGTQISHIDNLLITGVA